MALPLRAESGRVTKGVLLPLNTGSKLGRVTTFVPTENKSWVGEGKTNKIILSYFQESDPSGTPFFLVQSEKSCGLP